MTTFKKFHQQSNFCALEGVFSPTDHAPKRESKFFIIHIISIFRNKSQTLYAVSCILNLAELLQYIGYANENIQQFPYCR